MSDNQTTQQENPNESNNNTTDQESLSSEQRAKIERNRQAALLIRQKKESLLSTEQLRQRELRNQILGDSKKKYKDSGGGFLVEEEAGPSRESTAEIIEVRDPAPPEDLADLLVCDECSSRFVFSDLHKKFGATVCDTCNEPQGLHKLITRTEVKNEYLLKDCDIDSREPPLKFIVKKNPHLHAKGDMRLYLKPQVEQRALEVWGSEEGLEQERERRAAKRHQVQESRYNKKMKSLRQSVRSSLYTKTTTVVAHEHEFDPADEIYIEEKDLYKKSCKSCGHVVEYEKM